MTGDVLSPPLRAHCARPKSLPAILSNTASRVRARTQRKKESGALIGPALFLWRSERPPQYCVLAFENSMEIHFNILFYSLFSIDPMCCVRR